jgi:ketosteroid isomerase-like protein
MPKLNMIPSKLAPDWIAAWNSHDLDRVLAFYTDDFEMSSPHIPTIAGEPSGTLCGKQAVRAYWEKAMGLFPGLHFTLETVYTGANSVVICYTNQAGGSRGELLFFNGEGKCFRSAAHHAG